MGAVHITSGSPMSEERFVLGTFRSERTNEMRVRKPSRRNDHLCGMLGLNGSVSRFRATGERLGKVNSAFHTFSGSINEYQASLEAEHWVSRQIDHLSETSAHAT
ncbi:hypothetical protein TNCV_4578351 [Trichonephila clavipes]|nr:hypothetical protein TNCV_4578351 [Trichonephila clavipes]